MITGDCICLSVNPAELAWFNKEFKAVSFRFLAVQFSFFELIADSSGPASEESEAVS